MGSVILMVARSPSFMVRRAISHPRIIVPSSAIMRCRSDLANGSGIISLLLLSSSLLADDDGTTVQEYFTTIASPGRIARPVPSTMVVLDTPDAAAAAGEDDDDDDDDDVYEPSAAVEDRSIVVDGIANAARLLQRRRCLLRIFERVHDVVACRTKNDDDCQRVEDDGWRGEEKAPVVEMLLRERRW